jgi:hypothetical protein
VTRRLIRAEIIKSVFFCHLTFSSFSTCYTVSFLSCVVGQIYFQVYCLSYLRLSLSVKHFLDVVLFITLRTSMGPLCGLTILFIIYMLLRDFRLYWFGVLRSETNSASHLDAARFIHLIILMLSLFSLMVFSSFPRSFQIEMLLSAAHGIKHVLFYPFLMMANCYYSKIPISDVPWRRVADEHQSLMHAFDDIATQFTAKPASVSTIC